MKKKVLLAAATLLTPLLALSACGGLAPSDSSGADTSVTSSSSSEETKAFKIITSDTSYEMGTAGLTISLDPSSDITEEEKAKLVFSIVGDNPMNVSITTTNGVGTFAGPADVHSAAFIKVVGRIGGKTSDNSVDIYCYSNSNNGIASQLAKVLNGTVVFGQGYNLGIPEGKAGEFRIDDPQNILTLTPDGSLYIQGIGNGSFTLYRGELVIYQGDYSIFFSVLAGRILEELVKIGEVEAGYTGSITPSMIAKVKELTLKKDFVDDPDAVVGLALLVNLEKLDVSDNGLKNLYYIKYLTQLKELNMSGNALSGDVDFLKPLKKLTYLDASHNAISDLGQIKFINTLTYLNLSNNQIADINPVSSLRSLISLFVDNNPITTFNNSISGLSALKELGVGNCGISFGYITALTFLKNLTYLDVSGLNVNLSDVIKATGLVTLIMANCSLDGEGKDLSALTALKALTTLDLSSNSLNLANFAKLTSKIASVSATSLPSEIPLSKLTTLNLSDNLFVDVPDLSVFKALKNVNFSSCYNLSDLSGLVGLELTSVVLDGCDSITSATFASFVTGATKLEKLSILSGFNYLTKDVYSGLLNKIHSGSFALRFLDEDYVDATTVENYEKAVFFTWADFAAACTLNTYGDYVAPYLASGVREVVLSLVNDNGTIAKGATIWVPKELFKFDLYGNSTKQYDIRFTLADRKQSSFTFDFHNFNDAISTNNNVVYAPQGSKLFVRSFGTVVLKVGDETNWVQNNPSGGNCSFYVYDVTFTNEDPHKTGTLTVQGRNGQNCSKAANGYQDNMGSNGSTGGNGGCAVYGHDVVVRDDRIYLRGGNGGHGGDGGESKILGVKAFLTGTRGGDGGHGADALVFTNTFSVYSENNLYPGQGGEAGNGGAFNGEDTLSCTPGSRGNNGTSGIRISHAG